MRLLKYVVWIDHANANGDAEMEYRYEVEDVNGVWHVVTEMQAIAYQLDRVYVRVTKL